MQKILFTLMAIGTLLNADFTRSGDIVTDNTTKLQWQDNVAAGSTSTKTTWETALNRCEALILSGYRDWRLPNIRELKSITDRSKDVPAIYSTFQNIASDYYWSSTSYAGGAGSGWIVDFRDGLTDSNGKDSPSGYVRCVR
jgi:hypothetical protein